MCSSHAPLRTLLLLQTTSTWRKDVQVLYPREVKKRPLALAEDEKPPTKNPIEKLRGQQSAASKQRVLKARRMRQIEETKLELKQREVKLKEDHAEVELALKQVQLQAAQRDALVQVVLARKQLLDSGISVDEVDRLLPPPA
ncbi:hypothetical protein PR001_g27661 [Phytophthora rubi]|uniref:Uncharacterized protein n=1 Tax=Phytophthora rubi TaxID=129364 RepID=A0A6A3HJM6_9STRA|nr:hypothetical protein PR001_g27661 [Phytophthora rubi]